MPVKGPYLGVAMANVPADYLLHIRFRNNLDGSVMAYINDNAEILEKEFADFQTEPLINDDDTI